MLDTILQLKLYLLLQIVDDTMALKGEIIFNVYNFSEDISIAFDNDEVLCLKTRTQQYFVSVQSIMISP